MTNEQEIASGARRVDEIQHMQSGTESPADPANVESGDEGGMSGGPVHTMLGAATLSMFQQGSSVRVRIGSATNSSELYEGVFDSADDANTAILDAAILKPEQVKDPAAVLGAGIAVEGLSTQQLEAAGLKRHANATL